MDTYTTFLCYLNRRQKLRTVLSQLPIVWRVHRPIVKALERARLRTLELMPPGGVCAEIGTWKGDFSEVILTVTRPRRLHLVDPWAWTVGGSQYQHLQHVTADDVYAAVQTRFQQDQRVSIHRCTSRHFLESLAVGVLDWVYIDGDHREAAVAEDLKLAWRAVRPGGYLSGDDYYFRDQDDHLCVRAAVLSFCQSVGVHPTVIGTQFIVPR